MSLRDRDINLFVVFSAIWTERNLTRAADQLAITQSAVSHALKRLREEFQDPLFVRGSEGVVPTEMAKALSEQILPLLQKIEAVYIGHDIFDIKEVKRDLLLASGDYFAMTFLTSFIERLAAEAPGVRVINYPVANIYNKQMFERGEVDLAVTAIPLDVKASFHSQKIFSDKMMSCVRKNHSLFRKGMTRERYLAASHVNVSNFGKDVGVVEQLLKRAGKQRRVQTVVSSFYDAGALVEKSDLVLSAPKAICQRLSQLYNLKTYELNFMKDPRPVSLIWHDRTQNDPFHQAIREILQSVVAS